MVSWHILTPGRGRRRSDFAWVPPTPEFPLKESRVPAGGRTCGAGECVFLFVRLWLTGKSWNEDLRALYRGLGIRKHSCPLFTSPCLRLEHQSQHAFQLWLTEHLPAYCPGSLRPEVLAAWPLHCFALKGARSRRVEEFSFRTLAHFHWTCEVFLQMLVRCQISCGYP